MSPERSAGHDLEYCSNNVLDRCVRCGSHAEVLDVGRTQRLVTTLIWLALIVRDRHCAFTGWRRPPIACDAHHIHHWADGGTTTLDNLALLCRTHHMTIHNTPWEIRLNPIDKRPEFLPPARLDPDGDERETEKKLNREERAAHHNRFLSLTDDGAGGVRIKGRTTVEDAAVIKAALFTLAAPEPTAPGAYGGHTGTNNRTSCVCGDPECDSSATGTAGISCASGPGCAHDGRDPR